MGLRCGAFSVGGFEDDILGVGGDMTALGLRPDIWATSILNYFAAESRTCVVAEAPF